MAVKATIAIDESVMSEARDLVRRKRVRSFNALVETALQDEMSKMRADEIREAIRDSASDPSFQADMDDITEAFRWVDYQGEKA